MSPVTALHVGAILAAVLATAGMLSALTAAFIRYRPPIVIMPGSDRDLASINAAGLSVGFFALAALIGWFV